MSTIALFGKSLDVKGRENLIQEGPNIIVGNHCGSYKDVATLFKIVSRPIFFTANRQIFTKKEFNRLVKKHLKRHLHRFGLFLNFLINPFKSLFVTYVSTNIARIGTIPVNLHLHKKREAIDRCQDYLKKGRAIIALQGRGRVINNNPNPYVESFRNGTSIMAYNLYQNEGIKVPVTPLAMFGTQVPFLVPWKIKVNIGQPMYITDYLVDEFNETIERFKNALEANVNRLFLDLLKV
jgi:1-acyl-sn-glycerol-3-phosphate acyltransferase